MRKGVDFQGLLSMKGAFLLRLKKILNRKKEEDKRRELGKRGTVTTRLGGEVPRTSIKGESSDLAV